MGYYRFLVSPSIDDRNGLPTGLVICTVWSANAMEILNFSKESRDYHLFIKSAKSAFPNNLLYTCTTVEKSMST